MRPEHYNTKLRATARLLVVAVAVGGALSACHEPVAPRTFADFMEDRIAREGILARCNANREATLHDIECANARRAAASIALRHERERREALERESDLKLAELRRRLDEEQRRVAAAKLAEEQAYEALWRGEFAAGGDVASLEPVRIPGRAPARTAAEPSASGSVLEEIVVPGRFGWRQTVD
jgi:hypothetical protein